MTVKIWSIFMASLENMNFKHLVLQIGTYLTDFRWESMQDLGQNLTWLS